MSLDILIILRGEMLICYCLPLFYLASIIFIPILHFSSAIFVIMIKSRFHACLHEMHCRRKEIVSGGHEKEKFFEQHYFLRLQKQFLEKWGGMCPPQPPVPTALRCTL